MRLRNALLGGLTALLIFSQAEAQNGGTIIQPPPPAFTNKTAWTPTLLGSSTAGAPTYTAQTGTYFKIGKNVVATFFIVTTALGSPAGNMEIGGLPVSSSATANINGNCVVSGFTGWTAQTGYTTLNAQVNTNTTTAVLFESATAKTNANAAVGEFAAATTLVGFCIYPTDT